MKTRIAPLMLLLALGAVPACKPADAATVSRSSPQGFIPLVDRIAVATGDQTDLKITGLNGDLDGSYDCTADIIYKGGSGAVSIELIPGAPAATPLLTGVLCTFQYNNGSGVLGQVSNQADWFVGQESAATDQHYVFHAWIAAKSGRKRQFTVQGGQTRTPGNMINFMGSGNASDTTTLIDTIGVHMTVASTMRAGSFIKCRANGDSL